MGVAEYPKGHPKHREDQSKAPSESQAPPARGEGRGKLVLHQVGGSPELRGVPLIGTGPGGLANTRPGGELGSVRRLERELREMLGSPTALGGARFVIVERVSVNGILRNRRLST